MVAHEEPMVVRDAGVHHLADRRVVEVFDDAVAEEAAAGDHADDVRLPHRVHYGIAIDVHRRIQDQREAEPRLRPFSRWMMKRSSFSNSFTNSEALARRSIIRSSFFNCSSLIAPHISSGRTL